MKSKELIRQLQELDPTGETEVCIDNLDIYFVQRVAGYWDGRFELLVHDESKRGKSYSIIGAKVVGDGHKIRLHYMGVKDVIENDPDAPVVIEGMSESLVRKWEAKIAAWRAETKRIDEELSR